MTTLEPRLLKGFRDSLPALAAARQQLIDSVRRVYERYGFLPLETPALEYVDVLGKYLPESDTPEGGIFALRDADGEWVALRYDLTAPLSRVAASYPDLPIPFRRYQIAPVWRKEKPGPGRFCEFYQMDFDTVGVPGVVADAEACCLISDALEELGISQGDYLVRVSSRKILGGLLEAAGVAYAGPGAELSPQALTALRAIDKLDRIGRDGVLALLGKGRMDESGDFTAGAELEPSQIETVDCYLQLPRSSRTEFCERLDALVVGSELGQAGVAELREIHTFLTAAGYDEDRIAFDSTIVRGLGYYTGPVYEATLTFEIRDEKGEAKQFGSVFGGGRYDSLVQRFTGKELPATGASIGVDRLLDALRVLGKLPERVATAPVLVTVMDADHMADYQAVATELRRAGINTELYVGAGRFGRQLKYGDQTGKTVAVIIGGDERDNNEVALKDLRQGRELSQGIEDRKEWLASQPAQITVARADLVGKVQEILDRYSA